MTGEAGLAGTRVVEPEHRTIRPVPVGHGDEIARLHDEVDRVRRGRSARVLLTGESGIGTTTLADVFCAQLAGTGDDAVVVEMVAAEPVPARSATPVAFSAVDQLARALDAHSAGPRTTASRSAMALHDAVVAMRRPLAGDRPRPVVLALHDLQHVDPASAEVLTDLLRRLHSGGILVLATATDPAHLPAGTRAWWPRLFSPDAVSGEIPGRRPTEVRTVTIGGLDPRAIGALVATRRPAAPVPGPDVAEHLAAATGGHPVHLELLLRTVPDEVLAGTVSPPPRRSLAAEVATALEALPSASRRLLGALAVLGTPASVALLEQVAGTAPGSTPTDAVDAAVASGLVVGATDGPAVVLRFVHGLVRDAVYHRLPPGRVAELHCTAGLVVGGRTALAHAVAGAAGHPYPAMADALEESARAEVADHDEAATRLLWAAELSAVGADRQGRLLDAAVRLVRSGAVARLRELEPELRQAPAGAARDLVLGVLASEACDPDAHVLLQAASDGEGADEVLALAAVRLGHDHVQHGRGARAVDAIARVPALSDDPRLLEQAAVVEASGRGQQWGPAAGLDVLLDRLPGAYGPDPAIVAGRLFLADGRIVEAYARLHDGLDRIRGGTATTMGRLVHLYLAEAAFRLGRWDEAEAEARVGATTEAEPGAAWIGPSARATWAVIAAVRGAGAEARAHLERARADLGRSPHALGLFSVSVGDALVAHASGDVERAHRLLSGLADEPIPALLASPTAPWRALQAEAALDVGWVSIADPIVHGWPVAGTPLWFVLTRHRLLGRMAEARGDVEGARTTYRGALDLVAADPEGASTCPLEVGSLHASAGSLARRQGWASAAEDLTAARRLFAALGAQRWVAQVDAEIDAGVPGMYGVVPDGAGAPPARTPGDDLAGAFLAEGEDPEEGRAAELAHGEPATTGPMRPQNTPVPMRRSPDTLPAASMEAASSSSADLQALTPREREVVKLVAQGLTSREVAAALYVTPKAISYHLGNVFAKLGVTSRRQLWGRTFD
ncbi:helix-turn-helix transcriptional regulator [Actinomycetospora termitidis]|uniref:AAA family ATPase n=1 Tax=Actinomycetospora termitidis TaxID=3053470 RepID=A0ABT7MFX4_9PSEU|nr:LuxR family transcriptional regulator [Actinomycetospora sp. Odt1-22]MDL5159578.1 AAA family ATPase [Actinomycetospora sp. Odt1-22]